MKQLCITFLIIVLTPIIAQASDHKLNSAPQEKTVSVPVSYGIAMHGIPKYNTETLHLDYANPDAPKGGTIKHAEITTFDSVNPFALKGKAAKALHLVNDRLMRRVWDEPFTLYPLIAERIETPEDRSSITIFINPRAQFNDGSKITADDVLFTYETLKDQGRPNMRRVYQLISKAKKLGNLELKFSFGDGYDQETVMIMAMMPVLSKAYWENRLFDSATLEAPVSSGPYNIKSIDIGKRVIFERNTNYWAKDFPVNIGHYNFDTIIYDYYRDDTVALESFLKGDIDLRRETDSSKWETLYTDYKDIIKSPFTHGRPVQIQSMIFNTRRPPFDDIEVRKALNLAFDGNWINKNLYHGQKKRISSFFENSELSAPKSDGLWTPPESQNIRKQLREASKILTNAGWITIDGVRVNEKTKTPLEFEILVQKIEHEKIALNYISHLKRLGIKAHIRNLDSAAFRDRINSYDYDMMTYHWTSSLSPGTEQYQYWSCEAANQDMRWNFAGICDSEIDAILPAIPQAKTREEIVALVQKLDKQLINIIPTIPLFYTPTDNYLYRANINHPETTPLYGPVIETWWANIPQKQED